MTKEELEKEVEEKYCKGCKWRIEQCLWAWRKTNGLKEPNEKNCSCKEVPAYLAGAEPREKRIAELEAENERIKTKYYELQDTLKKVRLALIKERTANIMNYGKGGVEMFDSMFEILKGVSN